MVKCGYESEVIVNLNHRFKTMCIDWEPLLAEPTLYSYLKSLHKQGLSKPAQKLVEPYKDYDVTDPNSASPMYFGLGVEILAEAYLQHYGGHLHGLMNVEMCASIGKTDIDLGVDGMAKTNKIIRFSKTGRVADKGNDVFIQVKGTRNATKVYTANDGSRIPNFTTNAFSTAIKTGQAYKARYILFTTGKDLHYTLNSMSGEMIEVINHDSIKRAVAGDEHFWNEFRLEVGVGPKDLPPPKLDPEFEFMAATIDESIPDMDAISG
jgi:hypothetical protein